MRRAPRSRSVDTSEPDSRELPLPRMTGWLRPAVDAVARIRLSIHRKLLFGFLVVVVLLLCMGTLSIVVIAQMNHRVDVLEEQAKRVDLAEQMYYDVTAQSHYRAMALLQEDSDRWNEKVAKRKRDFRRQLAALKQTDGENDAFFRDLDVAEEDYSDASAQVVEAFERGDPDAAARLHLSAEHPASHVVEDMLATCNEPDAENDCGPYAVPYIDQAQSAMDDAAADFESDRATLHSIVIGFSAASILAALLLGYLLSWAFVRPVKQMQHALAGMSAGQVRQRLEVPNRDEFGTLAQDLNSTSEQLSTSFERQRSLAQRLQETNASLARASEAKSRFLASVSHELRTPMNAILGFTDALLAGVDGPLNDAQRESLGWVQRGGRDLLTLINEILDLSRIEAGRLVLDPQPLDPRLLVASVVEQQRPLAEGKGIMLEYRADDDAPEQALLDGQRVRQILVNVVGNAVKFTDSGRVEVAVRGEDSDLTVEVRDTGPGIAPEHHDTVFEEFGQVRDDVAGTGLGLAISRRLARAMGGDLTLESDVGSGCVFRLRLPPEHHPAQATSATDPPRPAELRAERLLLSIDDDPSVAPLLQRMLADAGYRVVPAGPHTAVADAARLRPDAILLDLLMEERAGEDVLRELKSDPATRSVPVVIVSVVDAEDVPVLADGRLAKPVDRATLIAALAELDRGGARQ